jgi:hypothetical protein
MQLMMACNSHATCYLLFTTTLLRHANLYHNHRDMYLNQVPSSPRYVPQPSTIITKICILCMCYHIPIVYLNNVSISMVDLQHDNQLSNNFVYISGAYRIVQGLTSISKITLQGLKSMTTNCPNQLSNNLPLYH